MTQADDLRRLRHIVECADELAGYLAQRSLEDFLGDRLLQRATERLLTIIGEAAKQVGEETRAAIKQPWREVVRFRDKGIHGYDGLSPGTLYRIATESVPELRAAVAAHLGGGK